MMQYIISVFRNSIARQQQNMIIFEVFRLQFRKFFIKKGFANHFIFRYVEIDFLKRLLENIALHNLSLMSIFPIQNQYLQLQVDKSIAPITRPDFRITGNSLKLSKMWTWNYESSYV